MAEPKWSLLIVYFTWVQAYLAHNLPLRDEGHVTQIRLARLRLECPCTTAK